MLGPCGESELKLKVKLIREQLGIPGEVSMEKIAEMVPAKGNVHERIDALYAKLVLSA